MSGAGAARSDREAADPRSLVTHVLGRQFDPESVGLRELPFTLVFAVVFTLVALSGSSPHPWLLDASGLLVLLVQVLARLCGRRDWPHAWRYVFPLAQLGALAALEVSSGRSTSFFSVMMFLPVVSLALQPGSLGVVLGTIGAAVLTVLPTLLGVTKDVPPSPPVRAVVITLCAFLVALGASTVTQRLREQARALEGLHDEQDRNVRALEANRDRLEALTQSLADSRALFVSMVDAATEQLVIATDEDGRIVASSPGAHALLGCDASALTGSRVTDFYEPAELRDAATGAGLGSSAAELLRAAVGRAAEGFPERRDWTFVRPDGSPLPVDVAVTRRPRLDEGATAGYLFVGNDLTERRESERLQDEFTGLVSHELRTPLASILGYVDLLRSGPDALSDEQARYLEVVERNAQRLLRLVNDLLLSVQLAAGTFQLTPERLDAAEVVRRSLTSLGPTAAAAGVTIDVDVPRSLPFVSDSVRLGQVTENLVANAVKFTPRGGHVRVTLRRGADVVDGPARLHPRADDVRLMVVDDGPGITEAELARVTERFFRSRDARNKRVSGLGLGLPIVASIVAAHGGHMDIDSAPGEGTVVVVDLYPLVPGPEASFP